MTDATPEEHGLGRLIALAALFGTALFALVALLHAASPDLVRKESGHWQGEAYAGCVALAYLVLAAGLAARHRDRLAVLLPLACVLLVGCALLLVMRWSGPPSWDYGCYFGAGQDIRHRDNVYALGRGYRYLYSPVLATLFSAVEALPRARQEHVSYFLWQVADYWAAMLFVLLLAAALRRYRLTGPLFWPALATVVIVNVPLQRTLDTSQVNLYVTNLILGYLLLSARRPIASGGLLGLATVLKTSPLLLLLLPVMERRVKPLLGAVLAAGAVTAGSIAVVGAKPWLQFVPVVFGTRSFGLYRDNSLQSLLVSSAHTLGLGKANPTALLVAKVLTLLAVLLLLWWATRPTYRALFADPEDGVAMGALPLLLVAMVAASPLLWEHHWVFLQLPFCLLVARAWRTRFALPALISYGLVYLVPTFDIFLLSYHRLAGLILWAVIVRSMATHGAAQPEASRDPKRSARAAA